SRLLVCASIPRRAWWLPGVRAITNASLALRNRGLPRRAARRAAAPLFERFGLSGFESSLPRELSGALAQRVALPRPGRGGGPRRPRPSAPPLRAPKPVLLLVEPFAGLDAITRAEMQEWLA